MAMEAFQCEHNKTISSHHCYRAKPLVQLGSWGCDCDLRGNMASWHQPLPHSFWRVYLKIQSSISCQSTSQLASFFKPIWPKHGDSSEASLAFGLGPWPSLRRPNAAPGAPGAPGGRPGGRGVELGVPSLGGGAAGKSRWKGSGFNQPVVRERQGTIVRLIWDVTKFVEGGNIGVGWGSCSQNRSSL